MIDDWDIFDSVIEVAHTFTRVKLQLAKRYEFNDIHNNDFINIFIHMTSARTHTAKTALKKSLLSRNHILQIEH